jgi:hypothetical protein
LPKRRLIAVVGSILGIAAAAAVFRWPDYALDIQMTLYSVMVLGLLLLGLWPNRHRPKFSIAVLVALLIHAIFLFLIRQTFPFRTILTAVPIAFFEGVLLFVLALKTLGDRKS